MPPPNILWYCTDQQRFDTIGALGNPHVRTPNLDGLVREGVTFTHTYCQCTVCLPSRASFMTGRYPGTIHANHNAADHFPRAAETTLVTRLLAAGGYDCGLVGKLHLADGRMRPEPRVDDGFRVFEWSLGPNHDLSVPGVPEWEPGVHAYEDWLRARGVDPAAVLKKREPQRTRLVPPGPGDDNVPPDLHQTTWCSERAIAFIESATRPWCLCVNPSDPHPPFDPPWEYFRRYDPADLPGPVRSAHDERQRRRLSGVDFASTPADLTDDEVRRVKAGYYAMIELIDDQLGRIVRSLEDTGQRDDTVIVFHSDHGEMLGDHGIIQKGCRFYEGLTRVPLIVSGPARLRRGLRNDALVELIDVAPTILELAGLEIPPLMQGRSLTSILTGASDRHRHRDAVRCEFYSARRQTRNPSYATMYRDRRWKLCVYHNHDLGELYDLENDPGECRDLWDAPEHADVRFDLMRRSFEATVLAADPGPPRYFPAAAARK